MHLHLWPLRQVLRAIPDGLHSAAVARLANHLMRGQIYSSRLAPLEGKVLCLAVTDTGNRWQFRVESQRLRREELSEPWDVRIQGTLADFLLLATRAEDPDTLFFARRLSLEGDTEAGLYVKNLLDALEFDGEAHLAAVLGAPTADTLVRTIKAMGMDRAALAVAQVVRAVLVETATPATRASQRVWDKAQS